MMEIPTLKEGLCNSCENNYTDKCKACKHKPKNFQGSMKTRDGVMIFNSEKEFEENLYKIPPTLPLYYATNNAKFPKDFESQLETWAGRNNIPREEYEAILESHKQAWRKELGEER